MKNNSQDTRPSPEATVIISPIPVSATRTTASPQLPEQRFSAYLRALTGLIRLSQFSEAEVLRFLRNTHKCDESVASLAEVAGHPPSTIVWIHDSWKSVDQELRRLKPSLAG